MKEVQDLTSKSNLTEKYNHKSGIKICKNEDIKKSSKVEDNIQCKFGLPKCIYCTHGGCPRENRNKL